MRKLTSYFVFALILLGVSAGNSWGKQKNKLFVQLDKQLKYLIQQTPNDSMVPRSYENGKYLMITKKDWCCGFPAGSYWSMFELTGDKYWKQVATENTVKLNGVQFRKNTHDLGFMVFCSYGNAYRLTKNAEYKKAVIDASESLITRFNPAVGCIRSWDHGKWQFPVIIDNMMNLEMLFWASKETGDPKYREVAIKHADTTLKNHFRGDMSSFHVVGYDPKTGKVTEKQTHQGLIDESSWARGQAWGLYGYAMCYRETGDTKYLDAAKKIASFILKNLPEDLVPYWDYNDPKIPNTYRDASAAAITASAFYMLSELTKDNSYRAKADQMVESLSSAKYLAAVGQNAGFLIQHCVGNMPKNSEVDTPLNYADYYYLEALKYKYNKK
jgi:rhamnogalacturonyl hydrolase YesR